MTSSPCFLDWVRQNAHTIDAVLLDVDGVLMTSHTPLPGSRELLEWLREHQLPFVLLTNDACNSPEEKLEYLSQGGLSFAPGELVSAGHALEELVRQKDWSGELFFCMGVLGEPCYAEVAGLEVTTDLADLPKCKGILVGEKEYDWESVISGVFNFFRRNRNAPLIVPNPDVYFPVKGGNLHPASGATGQFVQLLCQINGFDVPITYLGKPHSPIFEHARGHLERRLERSLAVDRLIMVGDSLTGDIAGGREFGCRTALILSGVTTQDMLRESDTTPELVFDRL